MRTTIAIDLMQKPSEKIIMQTLQITKLKNRYARSRNCEPFGAPKRNS